MSFFHPPPDLPVHLLPLWPWIWFQRLMLRRWVRETYGKGTPFRWTVNFYGEVILLEVCDPRARRKTPDWLTPPLHPNKRIAAALSGELMDSALILRLPSESWGPERREQVCVALDPSFRWGDGTLRELLPLPEP
ncbi:MAG: hypothetical protein KDA53_04125 [Hyphomonas sp.]|nr:hypothetical protein [Hyphomonas sp.]